MTGILYDILERQARRGLVSSCMIPASPLGQSISHICIDMDIIGVHVPMHYVPGMYVYVHKCKRNGIFY